MTKARVTLDTFVGKMSFNLYIGERAEQEEKGFSESQELAKINRRRNKFERIWLASLRRWSDDVVSDFLPGQTTVNQDDQVAFKAMATRIMKKQASETLGYNVNDFKQEDDVNELLQDLQRRIGFVINPLLEERADRLTRSFMQTASNFMVRTNQTTEAGSPPPVYRTTLKNYLYNHRLTIAVSETTWTDETTRFYSVQTVKDPLQNSVLQTLDLIEAGDVNAARRLNNKIRKLVSLHLSQSQRRMVDLIATPLTQAQAISAVRADAQKLGKQEKKWRTVGDSSVRPTHITANGQARLADEPFEVGGAQLQYPMDGSLGAPLAEVIGCRCVTSYV